MPFGSLPARRDALRIGMAGVLGLSLPQLLAAAGRVSMKRPLNVLGMTTVTHRIPGVLRSESRRNCRCRLCPALFRGPRWTPTAQDGLRGSRSPASATEAKENGLTAYSF